MTFKSLMKDIVGTAKETPDTVKNWKSLLKSLRNKKRKRSQVLKDTKNNPTNAGAAARSMADRNRRVHEQICDLASQ